MGSSRTATTSSGRKRKPKTSASWVWNHFEVVKNKRADSRIICQECVGSKMRTEFSGKSGTSTLSRNLLVKHRFSKGRKSGDPLQTTIDENGFIQDPYKLDDDAKSAVLNSLVEFVVDHQQPLNLVENQSFRRFCKRFNTHYSLPSRQTLTRSLVDHFEQSLLKFREIVDSIAVPSR